MAKGEIWFTVVEDDPETRHVAETAFPPHEPTEILGELRQWEDNGAQWAATDAAERYYHEHDGRESRWPLTFALFASEDGPELARVTVECEYEPSFYGWVQGAATKGQDQ